MDVTYLVWATRLYIYVSCDYSLVIMKANRSHDFGMIV